jgi:membrane protein
VKASLFRAFGRLKRLASSWSEDRCSRKAAALAFYTAFSLAPLVVIVVALASLFVPDDVVTEGVSEQAKMLIGESGGTVLTEILKNSRSEQRAGWAAFAALGVLLVGATTAFAELKSSLDDIWGVGSRDQQGVWSLVWSRLLSFGLVLSLAFLLLVSLLVNAALEMFSVYFGALFGIAGTLALNAGSQVASLLIIWMLFASIYKLLPEVHLSWTDVMMSAFITAVLFSIGRTLIGTYLGNSAAASVYGAASSLAVLLLWVYYSAMIFLLGAEITKIWWAPAALRRKDELAALRTEQRTRADSGTGTPSTYAADRFSHH